MNMYVGALLLLATSATGLQLWASRRRRNLLTIQTLFVLAQWLTLAGTLWLIDPGDTVHLRYAEILTYAVTSFALASLALSEHASIRRKSRGLQILPVRLSPLVTLGLAASILVTLWYFNAVGYVAFLEGLRGLLRGDLADVATLRLASYSGDQYFAPGFVNQFKNVLLPSLTLVTAYSLFAIGSPFRWLISVPLSGFAAAALIGTGQRAQLIQFALIVVAFFLLRSRTHSWKIIALTAVATIPILFVVTLVLGRADSFASGGLQSSLLSMLTQLVDRIFFVNQESGLVAFEYTVRQPVQWGAEWMRSLGAILPGRSEQTTLAAEVYRIMYKTSRGTAPPTMMGSVHHNFGLVGVAIVPPIMAVIAHRVSGAIERVARTSALTAVGMSGVIVVLATWFVGDPTILLNNGLVVYLGLWYAGARMHRAAAWMEADPRHHRHQVGLYATKPCTAAPKRLGS
jgi:oligosaccharide repeat unit polymerase